MRRPSRGAHTSSTSCPRRCSASDVCTSVPAAPAFGSRGTSAMSRIRIAGGDNTARVTATMTAPLVSIVIPVYNRPALVREAIASALAEGARVPLEVIVVDDCSTDDTWDVIAGYGAAIRAARLERNSGQGAARNRGLDLASAPYVKVLDSDDLLAAGHLEREVACAEADGADIVVSGWGEHLADGTSRTWEAPHFDAIV